MTEAARCFQTSRKRVRCLRKSNSTTPQYERMMREHMDNFHKKMCEHSDQFNAKYTELLEQQKNAQFPGK